MNFFPRCIVFDIDIFSFLGYFCFVVYHKG